MKSWLQFLERLLSCLESLSIFEYRVSQHVLDRNLAKLVPLVFGHHLSAAIEN